MTTVITASEHARCSASAAERWMNCAGSLNLAVGKPNIPSAAAAEGTFAHFLGTRGIEQMIADPAAEVNAAKWKGEKAVVEGFPIECDQEMVEGVQLYLDTVREIRLTHQWAEMPLHAALRAWDQDLGGTADYVTYDPVKKWLRVADFKYGAGVFVDVDNNKQAMLYALGVMLAVDQPVDTVEIYIVQPRYEGAEPVRMQLFPAWQLMEFAGEVAEAAKATRNPQAVLTPGPWCAKTFCPNRADCPELQRQETALMTQEFAIVPVDPVTLAKWLAAVPLVKERIKAIEELAYQQALSGVHIPGHKLVEKCARRQWTDEKAVIAWAKERAIEPFEEPELKSPAQLEKGLKKAEKTELAQFTVALSSGTVLVAEGDARPAVTKAITADDFVAIGGPTEALTANNLFD
jgi:hypothetical protein